MNLETIQTYVADKMATAAATCLRDDGYIRDFAIVLAKEKGQGPDGVRMIAVRGGEVSAIRSATCTTNSIGVLYMRQEDRQLAITLEHMEHGDLEWRADVKNREIGTLGEPVPVSPKKVTRFLPRRFMN